MTMTTSLKEEMERARRTARALSDSAAKSELDLYLDAIERRIARRKAREDAAAAEAPASATPEEAATPPSGEAARR